jgi:hypothetical protein
VSFSFEMRGKDGEDLLEKYGVNHQLFGLGPNSDRDSDAPYRLSHLRGHIANAEYADRLPDAARDAFERVQWGAKTNLESLQPSHCDTCTCPPREPQGWDAEAIKRCLSVPLSEIFSLRGGY